MIKSNLLTFLLNYFNNIISLMIGQLLLQESILLIYVDNYVKLLVLG